MRTSAIGLAELVFFIVLTLLYTQRDETVYAVENQNDTEHHPEIFGNLKFRREKEKYVDTQQSKHTRHPVPEKDEYF